MFASTQPLAARTLGEIATSLPGSTAVFRAHKLDFCCGGHVTLAQAAERRGLSADAIVEQLSRLQPGEGSAPQAPEALIDHILSRYHEVHRRELPELIRLATRVEAVHRANPEVPAGLADALRDLEAELGTHMEKEEAVLFPMLRGGSPNAAMPMTVMRSEHEGHGDRLHAIEELAHQFVTPAEACPTWRALYLGLRKLAGDLMEHIHLASNVLFPRFGG